MTIEPPDTLPEGWVGKPKEDYGRNRSGCSSLVALALLLAVFVVLVGMVALLIYDPTLIEKILNYPNLPQTQQALDLTARYNQQFAADSQATRNALGTQQAEFDQRATQDALRAIATQTAAANENALRSTQAAFNLQQTQAVLIGTATQAQLDLNASQTASANDVFATQSALNLILTAARSQGDIAAAQTQQAVNSTATQDTANTNATTTAAAAVSGQPLPASTPSASQP
jgi:hypothetical protein